MMVFIANLNFNEIWGRLVSHAYKNVNATSMISFVRYLTANLVNLTHFNVWKEEFDE